MKINFVSNVITNKNINFAGRKDKKAQKKEYPEIQQMPKIQTAKLLPALAAMAGITTLSSCEDDFKYMNMNDFKEAYFESASDYERTFSKTDETTYVFNAEKDSLYKETDEFIYSHTRVKTPEHTTVFGNIERKQDGKKLKFINTYNKEDIIESSILKDPKTKETFYVTYTHNGYFKEIKNKDGKELPLSKYGDIVAILFLGLGVYASGHSSLLINKYKNNK